MTSSQTPKREKAKSSERQERLAKALRENLKRRKAQTKGRGQPEPDEAAAGDDED